MCCLYLDKVMDTRTEYNFQKSGLKLMQGRKTGLENNMFSLKWGQDLRTVHTPPPRIPNSTQALPTEVDGPIRKGKSILLAYPSLLRSPR